MKMHDIDLTFSQFLRFLTKIEDYSDSTKCWIWKGAKNGNGYGHIGLHRGLHLRAHRVSYSVLIGKIPEGLVLDHLCRNRGCINPWHLEPVRQRQNTWRGDTGKHHKVKTHCPQGHEYTAENTILSKLGSRNCRACHCEVMHRQRAKKRWHGASTTSH